MRVGDTGPRNIIQWVSKAWTDHELKLPVFYRETLARLLVLERFRNLIEMNTVPGQPSTLIISQASLVCLIKDNTALGELLKLQTAVYS